MHFHHAQHCHYFPPSEYDTAHGWTSRDCDQTSFDYDLNSNSPPALSRRTSSLPTSPRHRPRAANHQSTFLDPLDLPPLTSHQSRAPLYLFIAITSAISWGSFLYYATHNERSSSSIVRSLTFQLTHSEPVRHFLGDGVRIKPLFGEFRKVDGSVSLHFISLDGSGDWLGGERARVG